MKLFKTTFIILIFFSNLLQASIFGVFATAPKCSDPEVIELIKKTYKSKYITELKNNFPKFDKSDFPESVEAIFNIRTMSYDKDIELRTCIAIAKFDNEMQVNMSYTVQLDETNKRSTIEAGAFIHKVENN